MARDAVAPETAPPARVSVLGASGYGGSELIVRLLAHPRVELAALASRSYLGRPVGDCWPNLAGVPALEPLRFVDADEAIEAGDVVMCATPHGATAPLVARALAAGKRVVDLSADFRIPPDAYREWYGLEHPHPELFERARYGLVELHRGELEGAELVASPGCNATAASLALAPFAAAGLLGSGLIAADIVTGASGAGRGLAEGMLFAELDGDVRPYKPAGTHRHTAEIERTLGRAAADGKALRTHHEPEGPVVAFNPRLAPMVRGILATCYARPDRDPPSDDEALRIMRDYYRGDEMIRVQEELPRTKAVAGSDRAVLSVRVDRRAGAIVAFGAIDNLGKGAAGQAVQGLNAMMGWPEAEGLFATGRWP